MLLGPDAPSIERLVKAGLLINVSHDRHRRFDPDAVIQLVEARVASGELGPLALLFALRVIAGEINIPGSRMTNDQLALDLLLSGGATSPRS